MGLSPHSDHKLSRYIHPHLPKYLVKLPICSSDSIGLSPALLRWSTTNHPTSTSKWSCRTAKGTSACMWISEVWIMTKQLVYVSDSDGKWDGSPPSWHYKCSIAQYKTPVRSTTSPILCYGTISAESSDPACPNAPLSHMSGPWGVEAIRNPGFHRVACVRSSARLGQGKVRDN